MVGKFFGLKNVIALVGITSTSARLGGLSAPGWAAKYSI